MDISTAVKIESHRLTGLFDLSGKEIKEGDLIRVYETAISETERQKEIRGADIVQSEFIGKVEWDEEGQDWELQTPKGDCIIGIPRHAQEYQIIADEILKLNVNEPPSTKE